MIEQNECGGRSMKLTTWNVNGIRSVLNKGALQEYILEAQPDILCLQETKAQPEQVDFRNGICRPIIRIGIQQ